MKDRKWSWVLRGVSLAACAAVVPRLLGGAGAADFWENGERPVELARQVAATASDGVTAGDFNTGSQRFDGEWAFGSYLMTTLGLGQVALHRPELRAELVPAMTESVERLIAPETNAFGSEAWGNVGLATLRGGHGHGYLGYANLALSMLRLVAPESRHAALSDELTEALAARLEAAPHALFETYPGEAYAPDMAYRGVRRHAVDLLGFGMMPEYAPGQAGRGDIDSGPVLFGVGVSATGFALAGARLHGDREQFTKLYRTADFVGVPLRGHFMSGGPLGNAILLAMTTASFEWRKFCRKVAS